jgi:hypothetical protein
MLLRVLLSVRYDLTTLAPYQCALELRAPVMPPSSISVLHGLEMEEGYQTNFDESRSYPYILPIQSIVIELNRHYFMID